MDVSRSKNKQDLQLDTGANASWKGGTGSHTDLVFGIGSCADLGLTSTKKSCRWIPQDLGLLHVLLKEEGHHRKYDSKEPIIGENPMKKLHAMQRWTFSQGKSLRLALLLLVCGCIVADGGENPAAPHVLYLRGGGRPSPTNAQNSRPSSSQQSKPGNKAPFKKHNQVVFFSHVTCPK